MNHPSPYPPWQPNNSSFPSPPYQDIAQLSQKLNTAEKNVDEYARLIASLYSELRLYQDIVCHICKQNILRSSLAACTNPTGFTSSQPIATSQYRDSEVQTSTISSVQAAATSPLLISTSSGGHRQPESRDRKRRRALSGDNGPDTTCPDNPRIVISPLATTTSPPVSAHPIAESPPSISEAANPTLPNSDNLWSVEHNPEIKHGFSLHLANTFTFASPVLCTKFSPDGTHFAIGLQNGEIHIYNMTTGSKRVLMRRSAAVFYTDDPGTPSSILTARFSLDNNYIATGGTEGQINIWEIARKRLRASFQHGTAVYAIDFSPDCRFLASASYDDSVCMWRMRDGSRITLFAHDDSDFVSVGFSPDGRYVAAGNDHSLLRIWDAGTYQLVATCTFANGNMLPKPLAFTSDGRGLVIGNKALQRWDFTLHRENHSGRHVTKGTMNKIFEWKADINYICDVSFTFDSRWIVAGSGRHYLYILDARSGTLACTLKAHNGTFWRADCSPSGRYIISGGGDYAKLWTYEVVE